MPIHRPACESVSRRLPAGQVEGSVCHPSVCYAKKRNYARGTVQDKLEGRYEGLFHPLWTLAMIFLVDYLCDRPHK